MSSDTPVPPTARFSTFSDVVDVIVPIAPWLTEQNIKDIVLAVHADPTCGPDLLAAYTAADAKISPSVLSEIWGYLQLAAGIAGVISSIASPIQTAVSLA